MNKQDFTLINGYPLNQASLARMQTAYTIFNALGNIVGDKTIISGCITTGSDVSNGVVYVNGEVYEFRGGLAQTKVIIKEETTNLVYKNNNSYPAVKTNFVTFGTGIGAMDWSDFKPGYPTKDIVAGLAGKADQAAFDSLATAFTIVAAKVGTIENGAQKNVQADWNEANNGSNSFIKNKPNISNPFLHKDKYDIGDVFDEDLLTVTFSDVGTADYIVSGGLVGTNSDFTQDANVYFQTREHTRTSFKLVLTEQAGGRFQKLWLHYALIPL